MHVWMTSRMTGEMMEGLMDGWRVKGWMDGKWMMDVWVDESNDGWIKDGERYA